MQRKVLTPNDFIDLAEVERRLLGFQRRYEQTAVPFDWRFTRADLHDLLRRLDEKEQLAKAARHSPRNFKDEALRGDPRPSSRRVEGAQRLRIGTYPPALHLTLGRSN
jgi:hypothetical protein